MVAIASASDDEDGELRAASDAFFTRVRDAICDCLVRGTVDPEDADAFAALAVSACEGAVILSRARGSSEPFEAMRRALLDHVRRLVGE
jgi:TetR/AcrR family transcriptional repressor of lmrAB and yxaGH operons